MNFVEGIRVFRHSSILIDKNKKIYIDPYKIDKNYNDADIILITHAHYDHFSEEDILKIKSDNSVIVVTKDLYERTINLGFNKENIITVEPNKDYLIDEIKIETIPAYNINKQFHPKTNNWVGYILTVSKIVYYIAGDTDITEENRKVKCDIALVPIGGTYTMNYKEAAELINIIQPKVAIPIHYGDLVGTKEDEKEFYILINKEIECKCLIEFIK